MKLSLPLILLAAAGAWAQTPASTPAPAPSASAMAPDTVVATMNGQKVTVADVQRIVKGLPPQLQAAFERDRKGLLGQYALLQHIAEMAVQEKLDQRSPYREELEYMRLQVLLQAKVQDFNSSTVVLPDEQRRYYETNSDNFTAARIKAIYIPFTEHPAPQADPKAGKPLTEAEAKARAEDVVKQIRGGADFVKMVKEYSKDAPSAAKDGDFGTIRKTDRVPEAVKSAIFSLKAGGVSDPIREANGYYIFRADEIGPQPFEQVKNEIYQEIKNEKLREWYEAQRRNIDFKVVNETYFAPPAAPAAFSGAVAKPGAPAAAPAPAAKK